MRRNKEKMLEISQNLVEIKAEQLKWCRYGFEFYVLDAGEMLHDVLHYIHHKFGACSDNCDDYNTEYSVYVDPRSYEKAVIDWIKEMFSRPEKIRKDMYQNIWVQEGFKKYGHPENSENSVLADPRPWESEYTINLNENP